KGTVVFRKTFFSLAAAIILMAVATGTMITMFKRGIQSNEELFNRYYKPFDAPVYREAADEENPLTVALKYYRAREYRKAVDLLTDTGFPDTLAMQARFFAAMSCMQLKDYGSAETILENLLKQDIGLITDQTRWYLGLCRLAMENRDGACEQFLLLTKSKGLFRINADAILEEMD
ncbi:MAG: CDC27 family protein, partial [Bacteroidetes bacterium]|nr:CDC27 family protein [Bacteroidota bacterium]